MKSENQIVTVSQKTVSLYIKREDLLHPFISGNKYRKLKYNLLRAKAQGHQRLLTFGGAFSNHIAAVAYAGQQNGFETIGIIRGEELQSKIDENPTLQFAAKCGMRLEFMSRELYRQKGDKLVTDQFLNEFGQFYLLPEGGTNQLAVDGCAEILTFEDSVFDYICCAAGTGGTCAGIINSAKEHQQILVFPVIKGDFIAAEIKSFTTNSNWRIMSGYEFGGYAKVTGGLVTFINDFYDRTAIPLDPIYTGKMVFGVMELIASGFFPDGSKILAIHTGGLQGIKGMNMVLKKKNLTLIKIND